MAVHVTAVVCLVPSVPCMAYWKFMGGGTDIGSPDSDYDWPDQHWAWGYGGNGTVYVNYLGVTTNGHITGGGWVDFDMTVSHSHNVYASSWVSGYGEWEWVDDGGPWTPIDYDWSLHIEGTLTSYGAIFDGGGCSVRAISLSGDIWP